MYAIVETGGFQYRITPGLELEIPRIQAEVGDKVSIPRVLLIEDESGSCTFGTPTVENASAEAEVISHGKGKKILVQKFKRRKKYRRILGHRTQYTRIKVLSIGS